MQLRIVSLLLLICALSPAAYGATQRTLDIYFIDVEGGQSTLLVTPEHESLLIDAGFAGDGREGAKPGNPADARDANRILAAAHDAGVSKIDYLLITHFHSDHDGGVPELVQLLPITTFIDHGSIGSAAERTIAGTMAAFQAYSAVRSQGKHLEPRPGERLPLQGAHATVVSAALATINQPLPGAGASNSGCGPAAALPGEPNENPRSTGVLVQFGKFRFLDVGDLSGAPLLNLVCPNNLIGSVDAYLVAHHGGADAAEPATFGAFTPRVAIMNNGPTKGGALRTYQLLQQVMNQHDVWQLHRSQAAGDSNFASEQIANLDDSTAQWIKLSANEDGSFRMQNARTGEWKAYPTR
jgi:beta-lactamase superfamily II metal-dependent hydrolase